MTQTTEQERAQALAEKHGATIYRNRADTQNPAYGFTPIQLAALINEVEQAARRAPVVPETIEQRAQKLKGLQVLIGATAGVPEAIELARSRFVEAYGRSPLHDDLAYACLLIEAFGAPVVPQWLADGVHNALAFAEEDSPQLSLGALRKLYERIAAAPQPPEIRQVPDMSPDRKAMHSAMCLNPSASLKGLKSRWIDADPVQMPEAAGWIDDGGKVFWNDGRRPDDGEIIYTDHQVRQLLASRCGQKLD